MTRTDSAHAAWRDEPNADSEAALIAALRVHIRAVVYSKLFRSEPSLEADILGEIWLDLPRFEARNGARFSTWVYLVALNSCRDELRKRLGRGEVSLDALTEAGAEFASRQVQPSRLEYAALLEDSGLLEAQLDRDILECKRQGESETEACRHLGITLSCYRQRWHRMMLKVREIRQEAANAAV